MTDLLSRLAVITTKDEQLLKKGCPFCGSIRGSTENDGASFRWQCDSCHATGPVESHSPDDGDPDWDKRPREAALTALVQEAAAELERLHKCIEQRIKYLQQASINNQIESCAYEDPEHIEKRTAILDMASFQILEARCLWCWINPGMN